MKKFICVCLTSLLLALTVFVCTSTATGINPRLYDKAGLLNDSESQMVRSLLDEKSESLGVDVVIVTVDEMFFGNTPFSDATEWYEYLSYSEDGVILYICMGTRDWQLLATGYAEDVLSDYDLRRIEDAFLDDLSMGYYYDAFTSFAECTQQRFSYATDDEYVDEDIEFDPVTYLIISLVVGFIIALIITGIWKGQLKSVKSKSRADDYIRCGSLNITTSRELYLYRHIDRRAKPQNTSSGSSGRSSSGRSYSGRGGKF